jgi:RNA polymerase sigma factor (sigma-70 family)
MGMPGEPDLILRAKTGDKVAFEALLEPIVVPAARLAYAMLQDRTEAEDVVQEAAVKAWRKLGTFRSGADFKQWFLAIVANQCRMVRRASWWSVLRLEHTPADRYSSKANAVLSMDVPRGRPPHLYVGRGRHPPRTDRAARLAGASSVSEVGVRRSRPALPPCRCRQCANLCKGRRHERLDHCDRLLVVAPIELRGSRAVVRFDIKSLEL